MTAREDKLLGRYKRACPVCGAEFYAGAVWVYRRVRRGRVTYLCGYRCANAYDREQRRKRDGQE